MQREELEQEHKAVLTRVSFEDQEKEKSAQDIYHVIEGCPTWFFLFLYNK